MKTSKTSQTKSLKLSRKAGRKSRAQRRKRAQPLARSSRRDIARAILALRRRRAKAGKAKLSFIEFVQLVKPSYQWYKHCLILAAVLQKVADGEIKRLMIFMPPRHGKSELASRLFTAYFLYLYPERFVGLSSYSAGLAYTLSRAARENYVEGGGTIDGKANAVKQWLTGKGGGFWATGVGGEATGKGWHLGVIDDPLKNAEQAASEVIREKQKEWYGSTWYTREEPWSDTDPHGALVVINTRWHDDDLSGWLLSEEKTGEEPERWHVVSFPAIAEDQPQEFPATCTVEPDWRAPGEALCPERRPLDKLKKIADRVGEFVWNALFQQRPGAKDGNKFKRENFEILRAPAPAEFVSFVRYWDKAGTKDAGCYTVGALLGKTRQNVFWVLDVVRGQWASIEREDILLNTAKADAAQYGRDVVTWIEQEPGSGGKESAEATVRNLAGFSIWAERVTGDKEFRAEPYSAQAARKNVKLAEADWNGEFIKEHCAFPRGKYKDQVDAAGGAFNKLALYDGGEVEKGDSLW
ncbi:MAG: phage terminase large subunit [Acidobacteria bacterium]|nr:phage terminase large subunit [Acidobacteriota bacterium]MCA1620696.1 phage terminase large subunit [Acidobacteriota bacterium]